MGNMAALGALVALLLTGASGSMHSFGAGISGDIYFAPASSEIEAAAKSELDELYGRLSAMKDAMVMLAGYDEPGLPKDESIELGRKRAASVEEYLVSKGADADMISMISFGNTRPAPAGGKDGAAGNNRRVRYRVVEMPGEEIKDGRPDGKPLGMPQGVCQRCKR